MKDKLSKSAKSYPEMLISPLDSKNELNLGISNEFLSLYESKLIGSRVNTTLGQEGPMSA